MLAVFPHPAVDPVVAAVVFGLGLVADLDPAVGFAVVDSDPAVD